MIRFLLFTLFIPFANLVAQQQDIFEELYSFSHQKPLPEKVKTITEFSYKIKLNESNPVDTIVNLFDFDTKMYFDTKTVEEFQKNKKSSKTYDSDGNPIHQYYCVTDDEGRILEEHNEYLRNEYQQYSTYKTYTYDDKGLIRSVKSRPCKGCEVSSYVNVEVGRDNKISYIKIYDPQIGTSTYMASNRGDTTRFTKNIEPDGLVKQRLLKYGASVQELDQEFVDVVYHNDGSASYAYGVVIASNGEEQLNFIKKRDAKHYMVEQTIFIGGNIHAVMEYIYNDQHNVVQTINKTRNLTVSSETNEGGELTKVNQGDEMLYRTYDKYGNVLAQYTKPHGGKYVTNYKQRLITYTK